MPDKKISKLFSLAILDCVSHPHNRQLAGRLGNVISFEPIMNRFDELLLPKLYLPDKILGMGVCAFLSSGSFAG